MAWLENLLSEGMHAQRLRSDLEYFAATCLKLRSKTGAIEPFILNAAQRKLHELIEEQKRKTGKVRAATLKGRQLGVSTYTAARFFHRCITSPGLRCFILGHTRQASSNLFGIVKRFFDHLPPEIKPQVGTSNAEELLFSALDSGYLVSVATSEGTGRSATAQLLHGSEVAFWDDLDQQMAGLLQVVPDIAGSEIILESTANGFNSFHSLWRKAQSGESEFQPIFLPWQLDPNYRRELPHDFKMDAEETKLAELYGLEPEQICWRRAKLNELGNSELFPQEYPSDPEQAFVSSTFDAFIPATLILQARREQVDAYGPTVIGVDPAHLGADRTSIAWRQGRCIKKVESRRGLDTMQTVGWIQNILRTEKIARVYVDVAGVGAGV
jgi:hypothetical protein